MQLAQDTQGTEMLLWKRAGVAIVIAMVAFTLLGAGLMAVAVPGTALVNQLAIGLFVGFWSGPFFGTAAAVGYHEHAKAHAATPAIVGTPKIAIA